MSNVNTGIQELVTNMATEIASGKLKVVLYTEFGRKIGENGNQGTDHGWASEMFIFGNVDGGAKGQAYQDSDFTNTSRVRVKDDKDNVWAQIAMDLGVTQAEALALFPGATASDIARLNFLKA